MFSKPIKSTTEILRVAKRILELDKQATALPWTTLRSQFGDGWINELSQGYDGEG